MSKIILLNTLEMQVFKQCKLRNLIGKLFPNLKFPVQIN